jgi:hypothetical protein
MAKPAATSRPPGRWIWVFGEIAGLNWVLKSNVMAFRSHALPRLGSMAPGDRACLYVTRGAFHNPTRDEARLAGLVQVLSVPEVVKPIDIAGGKFSIVVKFKPIRVLPEREGPPVRPLVERLTFIRRPAAWGHYFRSSPIKVTEGDFRKLEAAVMSWPPGSPR